MSDTLVDCPALHERHHDAGYPFGDRVPKRIRMTRTVLPDFPVILAGHGGAAFERVTYPAWTNSYGAVAAVLADGSKLGVKPDEFEVAEWHDCPACASEQARRRAE